MNKNVSIAILVVLLVIATGVFFYNRSHSGDAADAMQAQNVVTSAPTPTPEAMMDMTSSDSANMAMDATSAATDSNVKSFTVVGSNFKFVPSVINVKKGDKVKITFQDDSGFHNWVLDEFGANTMKPIAAGKTAVVEFTADKVGSFEYYCSVADHRQMGMVGNLIVQ